MADLLIPFLVFARSANPKCNVPNNQKVCTQELYSLAEDTRKGTSKPALCLPAGSSLEFFASLESMAGLAAYSGYFAVTTQVGWCRSKRHEQAAVGICKAEYEDTARRLLTRGVEANNDGA